MRSLSAETSHTPPLAVVRPNPDRQGFRTLGILAFRLLDPGKVPRRRSFCFASLSGGDVGG